MRDEACRIASRLRAGDRRFILAASAMRGKTYRTLRRHAKGGGSPALRMLFQEVRGERRRCWRIYVLSPLGERVKAALSAPDRALRPARSGGGGKAR